MNETGKMLKIIYETLDERKGEDIRIIDISGISILADYFVIVNGRNEQHVNALTEQVEEKLHRMGYHAKQKEGTRKSNWILLDYGDIILHIFDRDSRSFYHLERIWSDGVTIEPESLDA